MSKILGMSSAYKAAKVFKGIGTNMGISSNLVIEMVDRIAELERERDELLQRTQCTVESFNMDNLHPDQQRIGIERVRKYCVKQVRLHGYSNFTSGNCITTMQKEEERLKAVIYE